LRSAIYRLNVGNPAMLAILAFLAMPQR
jgi:hypothetical protein